MANTGGRMLRLGAIGLRVLRSAAAEVAPIMGASPASTVRGQSLLMQAVRAMSSFSVAGAVSQATDTSDALKPKMHCYQCEQTANGTGCTVVGQCGKSPEVAGLQDLQIFAAKGLGALAHHARQFGITDSHVDSFLLKSAFMTLTNVSFDDTRHADFINQTLALHDRLTKKLAAAGHPMPTAPVSVNWFEPATSHPLVWNSANALRVASGQPLDMLELMDTSRRTGIVYRQETLGKTVAGLQELVMYGIKGTCAYAAHAEALGGRDPQVYADVQKSLAFLASPEAADAGLLLQEALNVGAANLRVMELLSRSHSETFGPQTPTEVSLVPRPGKCILITGHDMHDLHTLLMQTEGKGIDVYTHGEMLPAHGYPGLKKFKHLAGHYGGAWYKQKMDFSYFPGAIVATTNCVLEPMALYRKNLFTTNETGLANVQHIGGEKDFSAVIKRAQELPGWTAKNLPRPGAKTSPAKTTTTVGFGHQAVLSQADKVVKAVQEGKLRHFFVVGGCDGHEPQRAYYSKLGDHLPKDTMLLTMGCGKFRLIDQEFGTLGDTGLPRLLDMGQCNDAYSAVVVALELAKAFKTDVNSLPLSLDISWFEQKAVAVLLTLLHLGVKNIRLGPALPAFITSDALNILVDKFALKPAMTTQPELDLANMMAKK